MLFEERRQIGDGDLCAVMGAGSIVVPQAHVRTPKRVSARVQSWARSAWLSSPFGGVGGICPNTISFPLLVCMAREEVGELPSRWRSARCLHSCDCFAKVSDTLARQL